MITLCEIKQASERMMSQMIEEMDGLRSFCDSLELSVTGEKNLEDNFERLRACVYRLSQLLDLDPDSFNEQIETVKRNQEFLQNVEGSDKLWS